MAEVDPSARLVGKVELADDVEIGSGCMLAGPVHIGADSRLLGRV